MIALGSVLAACGSGTDDRPVAKDATPDSAVVSAGVTSSDTAALSLPDPDPDATVGTTAVPPKVLEERVLPGDAFDAYPYAGAELVVVGVPADDVLNVRLGPGPEFQVVTTLAPTSVSDAVATGRNRSVESGVWAEIRMGGVVGWANTAFLMQTGAVNDDTANLFGAEPENPSGSSPETLARRVAAAYASLQPDSTVTVIDGPRHGDLSTVTVDVIGLGDDSIGGYRVQVFMETDDALFRVRTVETTTLCTRGVDGGVCV